VFAGPPRDGLSPWSGLFRGTAGSLYGTTAGGGAFNYGEVFRLDSNGRETGSYSFTGGADGGYPYYGALLRDGAGNLYGTAAYGGSGSCSGPPAGCGVVFKVDKTGKETVLHSLAGSPTDGANPFGGLVRDTAGNLYGTTYNGGSVSCSSGGITGCGVVFKLDTAGNETVLYRFTGGANGANPQAGLILDAAGNLYGTTVYGGDLGCAGLGCGVVFKITP